MVGLQETDLQIVQNSRLVEIAQGSEIIFSHQDIWIPQEGQLTALDINWVFQNLNKSKQQTRKGIVLMKPLACSQCPVFLAGITILV
jgi:hypothetical protein